MSIAFKILHFSDIHLTEDYDQGIVIKSFINDIDNLNDVKVVICSGDIASKGQFSDDVADRAKTLLFDSLRRKFNDIPIILCPGNHDVDLTKVKSIIKPALSNVKSPQSANDLINQIDEDILWQHLSGFNKFADEIEPSCKVKTPVYRTFEIDWNGKIIGIASLNSTWRTSGGGASDYGSLFMGEHQIQKAVESLKDAYIKIAVFHHPLEWLHISEQPIVRRAIMQNFDAALFGHNHDSNSVGVLSPNSAMLLAQSGCLYQSRDYFNGYLVLEHGPKKGAWNVSAREYYPERNEFDIAPRFSTSGQFYFESSPAEDVVEISAEAITEIQESFDKHLLSYTASDVAPKSVGAIFVEPLLSYTSERQEADKMSGQLDQKKQKNQKDCDLDVSSTAKLGEDIVFIGRSQSGKSTLLHYISLYRWHEFSETAQFGCFVSSKKLREGKSTTPHLLDLITSSFHGNLLKSQVLKLLELGKVVICIDDVDVNHSKSIASINEFMKKYRKCRYIFSQLEDDFEGINFKQKDNAIAGIRRVFIHSFKRKHTRFLVERWFTGSNDIEIKKISTNTDNLLRLLNVPRTPFIISTLLWIAENRSTVSLINQAAAIDNLLDGLLNKLQESKSRSNLDSEFKRHFLREYSAYLNCLKKTTVPVGEFEQFALTYFKNRGLNHSIKDLIIELTEKGVLFECDNEIGFKFDCFRAFFLAEKMHVDNQLLNDAIRVENIGQYLTEIDLLTGMHRDRIDILRMLCNNVENLGKKIGFSSGVEKFSSIKISSSIFPKNSFQRIQTRVLDNPNMENEMEDALDELGGLPDPASYDPTSCRRSREEYSSSSILVGFMHQLSALSSTLRNSELIEDVKLKQKAYDLALLNWENICITILNKFEQDKFKNEFNTDNLSESEAERIRMLTILLVPVILLNVMTEHLSTPKLEHFIERSIKRSTESSFEKLASLVLAMDINMNGWIEELSNAFKSTPTTSLSGYILFFKSLNYYLHSSTYRLNPTKRGKLKETIVTRIAFTQSKSNAQAQLLRPLIVKEIDKIALSEED